MPAAAAPFVRDHLTWLAYLSNAWGTYSVATLSPLMAFLAVDLGLNYTQRGLHTSAFAAGIIIAGIITDRVAMRFSRRALLWVGGTGLTSGLLLIAMAESAVLTITGAFLIGLPGTVMFVMGQAALADRQSENRSIAFTESSVGASVAGLFAPLLISLAEALALGWRAAVLLSPVTWAALFVWGRPISVPAGARAAASHASSTRLSRLYWVIWFTMFLGAATEWSVSFWTPEFLTQVVGIDAVTAAGALTLFWLALIAGRVAGTLLSRRFQPLTLLIGAAALVTAAFPVLWLARSQFVAFGALFAISLGLANFFPLTLALATAAGSNNINAATARTAVATGVAVLIVPQLLGSLGDAVGIGPAYAIIGVLAASVLGLCVFARWAWQQRAWRSAGLT